MSLRTLPWIAGVAFAGAWLSTRSALSESSGHESSPSPTPFESSGDAWRSTRPHRELDLSFEFSRSARSSEQAPAYARIRIHADESSPEAPAIEVHLNAGAVGDIVLRGREARCIAPVRRDPDGVERFAPEAEDQEVSSGPAGRRIAWWGRSHEWRDEPGFRGELDLDRQDAWTPVRVIARSDTVRVFVDGLLVNEIRDVRPNEGRVSIEPGSGSVEIRNLHLESPRRIAPLPRATGSLRAGAAAVDITPDRFPIRTNGGFTQALATEAIDRLHARALVLDDGLTRLGIAVVDSCMIDRELIEEIQWRVYRAIGIPPARLIVCATHTHTAPAVTGVHGTDIESAYRERLATGTTQSVLRAASRLEPARLGSAVGSCPRWVHCRRWLMRPGKAWREEFTGRETNLAQMNPGHSSEHKIRQTGVVDPSVSVLSIQRIDGRPLALFANYSTHYAGSRQVSADYFGEFARLVASHVGASGDPNFVAMMSNGTSGDANCIDFRRSTRERFTHHDVARDVAQSVFDVLERVRYRSDVALASAREDLKLGVRVPTPDEVASARAFLASEVGDRPVRNVRENYARETVLLAERPATRRIVLQSFRIGELAVAAIPCEVYGITGLSLKAASPFPTTINVSLAGGAEGYIPPPDQFRLGGYTTWRARTSCLEADAEPKIRRGILKLLDGLANPAASTR